MDASSGCEFLREIVESGRIKMLSSHPKIQTESKQDILFLKKELESAGALAMSHVLGSSAMEGTDLENTLHERIHSVNSF